MYRFLIVFVLMFLAGPGASALTGMAKASDGDSLAVRFAYDLDFEMNFDNREYDRSDYSESMTIFGARLTPSAGIDVRQRNGISHRVMLGIDIMKDFGASPVSPEISGGNTPETDPRQNNLNLFREMVLYYRLSARAGKTDIRLTAGVFPRSFSEGEWPVSFFSDSLKFYDNNLDGLLVSFRRPKSYYEVGCDWMGKYGVDRRERFMIFTCGNSSLTHWLSLGYSAYLYHVANSSHVGGVVDNALVNPYVGFDFSYLTGMQSLGLSFGWLQSFQQDRKHVGRFVFPMGGEFVADVRRWNVGLEYRLFYGTDMMPYYNSYDSGGYKYGNMLYMGDPFYRVRTDGSSGCYQRLEVSYEPTIAGFMTIRIGAVLHFNESFSGWQQMVGLKFSLERLLKRTR